MAKSKAPSDRDRVDAALEKLVARLNSCRMLRKSSIVIRASGGGGDYCLDCSPGGAKLTTPIAAASPLTIEIIGETRHILALLTGQKDPRKLFFAGVIRVRGDLRYLSDLALEAGILKEPL